MTLVILGMGTAVPPQRISQEEAVKSATVLARCDAEQSSMLTSLYRQTEIAGRHMVIGRDVLEDVLFDTTNSGSPFTSSDPGGRGPDTAERMRVYRDEALPLALSASLAAMKESGLAASEITHLVTVSCTGLSAPGFDIGLIKALALRPTVERTHVGFMGCHGALNGMRLARAFVEADVKARVLVCAAELSSIHYHYGWDPKRMVGNALFGDGAAALVAGSARVYPRQTWHIERSGSCLFPDSEYALTWNVGNHGFDMTLSSRIPELIGLHLPRWLESWLSGLALTVQDIPTWAIHPGGPRVLSSVEECLGLAPGTTAASWEILRELGNMSSPTILFILERLRRRDAKLPCVALAFGPGMTVEAALIS